FWARGVMLAQGQTPRMDEVAQAIDKWVASSCGISYKFAGEFLNSHIFEEYVTNQKEVVAKGELLKLKGGKTVAVASVQFTYSAKPPDIKDKVNAKYPSGKTDLMYAAAKGDLVKAQALLAEGANVNSIDPDGNSALIYVLSSGREKDLD